MLMAGVRFGNRWKALWQLIGRHDLAEDPRYLGGAEGEFFVHNIVPAIEEWSSRLSKWEVAGKLTEVGFSMGVTQTIADLAHCPHLQARQMFVETGDTLGGRFTSVKTPVRLTACVPSPQETPPTLGQHNREVLGSLGGLTPEELDGMAADGVM